MLHVPSDHIWRPDIVCSFYIYISLKLLLSNNTLISYESLFLSISNHFETLRTFESFIQLIYTFIVFIFGFGKSDS